jgi:hypothetical protein
MKIESEGAMHLFENEGFRIVSYFAVGRISASDKAKRDRAVARREFVASRMSVDQIAEAQKMAREWKPEQ